MAKEIPDKVTTSNLPAVAEDSAPPILFDESAAGFQVSAKFDEIEPNQFQLQIMEMIPTAGTVDITKEQKEILFAPPDPDDIEIRPEGLVYLPWMHYATRLRKAFPLQWTMIPQGLPQIQKNLICWGWYLVIQGKLMGFAIGETEYRPNNPIMSFSDACEGAKSNALMRLCKGLGITLELWNPSYCKAWKTQHAESWREPDKKTGKMVTRWKKKTSSLTGKRNKAGDSESFPSMLLDSQADGPQPPDELPDQPRQDKTLDEWQRKYFQRIKEAPLVHAFFSASEENRKDFQEEVTGKRSITDFSAQDYMKATAEISALFRKLRSLQPPPDTSDQASEDSPPPEIPIPETASVPSSVLTAILGIIDKVDAPPSQGSLVFYLRMRFLRNNLPETEVLDFLTTVSRTAKLRNKLVDATIRAVKWADSVGGQQLGIAFLKTLNAAVSLCDEPGEGALLIGEVFNHLGVRPGSRRDVDLLSPMSISPAIFPSWPEVVQKTADDFNLDFSVKKFLSSLYPPADSRDDDIPF